MAIQINLRIKKLSDKSSKKCESLTQGTPTSFKYMDTTGDWSVQGKGEWRECRVINSLMKENIEICWKTKIYLTPSASNETRQEILLQNIINNKIFRLLLFQKKLAQIFTMLASLSGLGSNVISYKRHLGPALLHGLHWEVKLSSLHPSVSVFNAHILSCYPSYVTIREK